MLPRVARPRLNWNRFVSLAAFCVAAVICIVIGVKKYLSQEYYHATVAGVLGLYNLVLGLRGATKVSEPLSDSMSEAGDFLAGREDGTDL